MDYTDDGRTSKIGASTKIMIVAILSLLIVVAIIVALHFYSSRLLRREERRRRRAMIDRLSMQILPIAGDSNELARDVGLAPSVIASIPTSPYNRTVQHGRGEQVECSVCLMGIEDEEVVRVLPNCNHMFHVECVDMWLGSHSTCPICRTEAEPKAQQESINGPRVQPSAPEVDSGPNTAQLEKVDGSGSRLGSFRYFVTRSRSSREEARVEDTERQ